MRAAVIDVLAFLQLCGNSAAIMCAPEQTSKRKGMLPAFRLVAFHEHVLHPVEHPVVASMMGWSAATAIRMAKRYGHIGSQALRDAADVLGGMKISVGSLKKSPKSQEAENVVVQ
jgi:hypothetical protein